MVLSSSRSRYVDVYKIVARHGCSSQQLQDLKNNFRTYINSQRVFERITTLSYLLKILEKRDVLGPENTSKLAHIIEKCFPNNMDIQNILYNTEPVSQRPRLEAAERVLPPVLPNIIDDINEMIKQQIGGKWRELARALNVPEGAITRLERYYCQDLFQMVHEVLTSHQEKCRGNYELWRSRLQKALVKARRTDLSEQIDDMLLNIASPITI